MIPVLRMAEIVEPESPVTVLGAGPAGAAAALVLARAGREVRLLERSRTPGHRFHGDFQGLENWSRPGDVLEELKRLGIAINFDCHPFHQVSCFGPDGHRLEVSSSQPLFYLVRRGDRDGCLDLGLVDQLENSGVTVEYGKTLKQLPEGGLVCIGPHRANAVATGFQFACDLDDMALCAVSDSLAPAGYAYLLVQGGQATLACCMFRDFHNESRYLERAVDFFERHGRLRLDLSGATKFGGLGNFTSRIVGRRGRLLYAGEAAGLQDPLFGFGMRLAFSSGAQAARCWLLGDLSAYPRFCRQQLQPGQMTALANRWLYGRLGDRGYRQAMRRYPAGLDARDFLGRLYRPRWWKQMLGYWVGAKAYPALQEVMEDCTCTWCRCSRQEKN